MWSVAGAFAQGNASSPYITDDHELYQPPIKTITWYHTGATAGRNRILSLFRQEYFSVAGFAEHELPEPTLTPEDLTAEEWREAARACKGMVLRQKYSNSTLMHSPMAKSCECACLPRPITTAMYVACSGRGSTAMPCFW